MSKLYQQGDVLFHKVDALPKERKPMKLENGRYVLARGETTGHAHVIDRASPCRCYEYNHELYLSVTAPTPVKHEEHHTMVLPKGKFKIGTVREVDPFTEEINAVRD